MSGGRRGPNGPPGKQNIVYQYDLAAIDRKRDFGGLNHRMAPDAGPIIPVQGDVQDADRKVRPFHSQNFLLNPPGHEYPPGLNPYQNQIGSAFMDFQYFMGHPGQDPIDIRFIQQNSRIFHDFLSAHLLWKKQVHTRRIGNSSRSGRVSRVWP